MDLLLMSIVENCKDQNAIRHLAVFIKKAMKTQKAIFENNKDLQKLKGN